MSKKYQILLNENNIYFPKPILKYANTYQAKSGIHNSNYGCLELEAKLHEVVGKPHKNAVVHY